MGESVSVYAAECWATDKSKEEIQSEINYLQNLWKIKHPNPFPKNAHYSYIRIVILKEILKNK